MKDANIRNMNIDEKRNIKKIYTDLGEYVNGQSEWLSTNLFTQLINWGEYSLIECDESLKVDIHRPINIIPVHRESEVLSLDPKMTNLIVLNDNYSSDVDNSIYFYNRETLKLIKAIEITDPDYSSHTLLLAPVDMRYSIKAEHSNIIEINGATYSIVGQVIAHIVREDGNTDLQVFNYHESPNDYFGKVDSINKGKFLNDRMINIHANDETTILINLVNKKFPIDHPNNSIGRARAYPIMQILKYVEEVPEEHAEEILAQPIFWMDADSKFEDGYIEAVNELYQKHDNLQSIIALQRMEVNKSSNPEEYLHHSLVQLERVLTFLTRDRDEKPVIIGGPQISSRLSVYTNKYSLSFEGSQHEIDLLQAIASCTKNEDFLMAGFLQHVFDNATLLMVPGAVIVKARFNERADLTAVAGDSQQRSYVFPQWNGNYGELYLKILKQLNPSNDIFSSIQKFNSIEEFRANLLSHFTIEELNQLEDWIKVERDILPKDLNSEIEFEDYIFISAIQRLLLDRSLKSMGYEYNTKINK